MTPADLAAEVEAAAHTAFDVVPDYLRSPKVKATSPAPTTVVFRQP